MTIPITRFRETRALVTISRDATQDEIDSHKRDAHIVVNDSLGDDWPWLGRWARYLLSLGDEGKVVWAFVTPSDFEGSPFAPGKNLVDKRDIAIEQPRLI